MAEYFTKDATAADMYKDSPRLQLIQMMLDDTRDEEVLAGTIRHRCNHLYGMVNRLIEDGPENLDQFSLHSAELSMKRELDSINRTIDLFREAKLTHLEKQNACLKLLEKGLKKHTSIKEITRLHKARKKVLSEKKTENKSITA